MADKCLIIAKDYAFPWRTSSGLQDFDVVPASFLFATDRSGFEGNDDFRLWICSYGLLVAHFSWILLCGPGMTHHFSIDPRSVLGVGVEASMEEIQRAFRAKSKKHHPDLGGDKWAFRVVVRAYEILKTTRGIEARHGFPSTVVDSSGFKTHWRDGKAKRDRMVFTGDENLDVHFVI